MMDGPMALLSHETRGEFGCPFDTTADDIIYELFAALDSRGIISFRQTCRRIYEISKTYSVWTRSREFENWTSQKPSVSEVRRIEVGNCNTVLVPGGRWLLAILYHPHSHLAAFDLDTEAMDKHVLVENLFPFLAEFDRPEIHVSVDKTSPIPSFTLAIRLCQTGVPQHAMKLWEIRLSSDLRTLEAAIPSTLALDKQSYTPHGEILHSEAGLVVQSGRGKLGSTLDIINWKKSTSTVHFKAAILQENGAQASSVYFVNEAKTMFIIRFGSFAMYDVPEFKGLPIQPLPTPSSRIYGPRWTYTYECRPFFPVISPPLCSSLGRLSFAIWTDHLRLFTAPNLDTTPICSWEGSWPWFSTLSLGSTRSVLASAFPSSEGREIRCLTYLPLTSSSQHLVGGKMKDRFSVRGEWIVSEGGCMLSGFDDKPYGFELDEASGRMIKHSGDGLILIWDLAN
ncbi:hypothetical protein FRB95_005197 [Tulasnella sp. JGI-2019a]|nr:hypothetical protein FRB95_005197 [Tulasnella sp. JGI-2019a]